MKKFLLRVKGEEAELASVLPLINAVLEQHEDNQVAIVYTDTLEIEDFWLPERCWAYPISKKETESMFAAHKFAANLYDVFNTDYYFDFVNDMYSAALGLAFRADVKIGLQGGAKSFFYQISLERFVGEYLDEQKVSALSSIEGDYNSPSVDVPFSRKKILNIFIPFPHTYDQNFVDRINQVAACLPHLNLHGYISEKSISSYQDVKVNKKIKLFNESTSVLRRRIDEFDAVVTNSLAIAQMSRNRGQLAFVMTEDDTSLPSWKFMPETIGQLRFSGKTLLSYGILEEIQLKSFSDLEDYFVNYQSLRLVP